MEKQPAPRPMAATPLLAPPYMPLVDNGNLQSGLGCIPGETESERVGLETDGLISGRGCVP